jgi:hypothetical protein
MTATATDATESWQSWHRPKALESVAPDRAGNYEIPRLPRGCQAEDPSYVLVSRP